MQYRRHVLAFLAALLGMAVVPVLGGEMEFLIDPKARWGGTAHEADIRASPRKLKQLFGLPLFNDGDSESLGTYVFASSEGAVLTLYYRAYDVPKERIEAQRTTFWEQEHEVEFHIGAKSGQHVPAFKAWLVKRLAAGGA